MVWLWLIACTQVEPSGRPYSPVIDAVPAPSADEKPVEKPAVDDPGADKSPPPDGTFDFEAEDRDTDVPDDTKPLSDADVAAALGLGAAPPTAAVAPIAAAAPTFPPPPANWGIRLVSTVVDAQPPRAILGMPDGTESVVQPGDLLPAARLVVLAIGRDAVQVAQITPRGDHAVVDTYVITALFPTAPTVP